MSNIDKQALRSKALSASPDEWIKETSDGWGAICSSDVQANGGFIIAHFVGPDSQANREFVQAANPATVLALLDELEAEQRINSTWRKTAESNREKLEAAEKRIAELEARDVKPVAWLRESALKDIHTEAWTPIIHMESERMGADLTESYGVSYIPLYTAPPAPVSVPDEMTMQKALSAIDQLSWQECTRDAYMLGWNACRAAMLQGAENAESRCTMQTASVLDSSPKIAESRCGNSPIIPDCFCIMPKKLTVENGGKGALSGEFHVTNRIVCQSCAGEGCEDCNDEGGWDAEIPVSWDTIKRIHEAAVEACSLPAAPQQEVK